jgi:hypothetical protein
MKEFRDVFGRGYLSSERFQGGGRFRFRALPGLAAELGSLAERERACCPFFRFEISERAGEIWWETRVDPEAEPVLEAFLELPALLGRGD